MSVDPLSAGPESPPPNLPATGSRAAGYGLLDAPFVAVLTLNGEVEFINSLAPGMVSGPVLIAAGTEGKPLWETYWWDFDSSVQERIRQACLRAARGEGVSLEVPMRSRAGVTTVAEFAVSPVPGADGAARRLVAWAVDASARRIAEDALIARDRHKDEFLAMLAHELRNPLAPLRNAAALMRLTDDGNPQRTAISALVERQVKIMSRLLDDLLDASRIDRGKIALTLEPVEMESLLAQILDGTRAMTDARGQEVVLCAPASQVWLTADPVRITQIVESLLTNAAKFTDTQGTIRITLTASESEAKLSVADNGQGIEAELLPRVFDLFTQGARPLDRSQGGLGIGLSLARNLAYLHGGTVTAASDGSGRGSEFIVTLPLRPQGPSRHAVPVPPVVSSRAKRVLVVDDNVDAAESLAELLSLKGHQTCAVTQSKAALELAPAFAPEVVLLDIGLPEIDGFQVARLLRQMLPTRNSLLVAVTGYGQPEDRKATSAAGFDHHLVKPVSLRQIEELIDRQA